MCQRSFSFRGYTVDLSSYNLWIICDAKKKKKGTTQ